MGQIRFEDGESARTMRPVLVSKSLLPLQHLTELSSASIPIRFADPTP
jgi:hypothetical protein